MTTLTKITPSYDPWEAYLDIEKHGQMTLSNIEFTTTNLCNMRCAHCAVGYTLQTKDPDALPIELILKRLDEIPHLQTLSITGGEPMMSKKSIQNYVLPLLKYAHERGVRTQMNSNLTIEGTRYLEIAPYLDVLHISHNWGTIEEFVETGFAMMDRKPTVEQRAALFQRMIDNSKMLAENGVMVSAETMLNKKTLPYLDHIHRQIVEEMKCARHEIHPMYPSDFASALSSLSLNETREAIHHILDVRDENTWMLFGTLPFYPCSSNEEDQKLLTRLREAKNVTLRNDPDGRSRLNINIFTGDVIVTDFGDTPALGNIQTDSLPAVFDKWLTTDLAKSLNCHCPAVKCLGPNVLVKNMYYENEAFISGSAK
ncbi:radical SAM/CxCxxxxC motif protein YfkAB [Solibacillus sp. R5-41]|uniref:radical SAM/CxCxxxxC motif protein YfkAB n=1 Tax=Solibacillus sp. R5-41 TaxID=2048654 RepID=UPI000C12914D|nr:radical SAM/CxCxxxxC motif protein YfkAB [Solibacillus sp. R5-41]ATP40454.1 radical SAM/CxCxxxxC motif protein YfkAB [Solibacillus sp. R5-41]